MQCVIHTKHSKSSSIYANKPFKLLLAINSMSPFFTLASSSPHDWFVVAPMILKAPKNRHNSQLVMGVKDLISSQGIGYGGREKVERMGKCLALYCRWVSLNLQMGIRVEFHGKWCVPKLGKGWNNKRDHNRILSGSSLLLDWVSKKTPSQFVLQISCYVLLRLTKSSISLDLTCIFKNSKFSPLTINRLQINPQRTKYNAFKCELQAKFWYGIC